LIAVLVNTINLFAIYTTANIIVVPVHYTHHQVSLMVSRNTTLVPSLGLRIGPACEAGLSVGMRRERVLTTNKKERKKERKKEINK